MSKRIITTYAKLNPELKKAIKEKYPDGLEEHLTVMKNVIKGNYFDGFIFEHEDVIYMIEYKSSVAPKIIVDEEIEELGEMPEGLEGTDDDAEVEDDEPEDQDDDDDDDDF